MVDFVVEFQVGSSGDGYKSFIAHLRHSAADPHNLSHSLPVLFAQVNPPTRFFDVVLRTSQHAVRFRVRRDNLYLEAYRDENGAQWYEFNNAGNQRLVVGSEFLGFTGSYIALAGAAGRGRDENRLGRDQLEAAVNDLAVSDQGDVRARALIVVIQMICESTRFVYISNELGRTYTTGGLIPDTQIQALENGWGLVSGAILHRDNNPQGPFRLITPNDMRINNLAEAIVIVGILLRQHAAGPTVSRSQRDVEMAMATAAGKVLILDGRPLVEVFYVRVMNIDGENPGQLYGTIKATDGIQSYYLYNRTRAGYEPIEPGENITLTGPGRAIAAAGDFLFDFNLYDSDSLSPDDEISKGQIAWNVYDPTNIFDRVKTDTIKGSYGATQINYVIMSNAAEALVDVVLISGDGEDPANVYGRIYSQTSTYSTEIDLFNTPDKTPVPVRPRASIPLLRSAVAVPMDAKLKVTAQLWDYDALSPNDEIAKGTAVFTPEISKSAWQTIVGKYGKVEVRVSWT